MKNILFLFSWLLLFSCNGNGQTTDPRLNNNANSNFIFNGDYDTLLTLEMATVITGFDAANANKMHTMKGMMGETLRYYWENGREFVKEKAASNRKKVSYPRSDSVQLKWVDAEADKTSFLDFIDLEAHPELVEINGVGENAFWNAKKQHLEVFYHGVSFTLQVDMSNDETVNKQKTIALAKLIISEKLH